MDKDSRKSIEYRESIRADYLNNKRMEVIKKWAEADKRIFWDAKSFSK